MSKKSKRRAPKHGAVWHLSSEEATLAKKPRYNGFACGHGPHSSMKYNRTKAKRAWLRDMQKGPHGPFFAFGRYDFAAICSCIHRVDTPMRNGSIGVLHTQRNLTGHRVDMPIRNGPICDRP